MGSVGPPPPFALTLEEIFGRIFLSQLFAHDGFRGWLGCFWRAVVGWELCWSEGGSEVRVFSLIGMCLRGASAVCWAGARLCLGWAARCPTWL